MEEYGYMKVKQDKYIDLNQFACNKNGRISWKDSEGVFAEKGFKSSSIQKHLLSSENKPYKGHIFNYVSYEE